MAPRSCEPCSSAGDVIIVDARVVPEPTMLLQWLRAEPNARHARIAVLREHTPLMGEDDAVTHALYRAGADLVIDSTGGRFSVLKWLMLLGTDGPSGALN